MKRYSDRWKYYIYLFHSWLRSIKIWVLLGRWLICAMSIQNSWSTSISDNVDLSISHHITTFVFVLPLIIVQPISNLDKWSMEQYKRRFVSIFQRVVARFIQENRKQQYKIKRNIRKMYVTIHLKNSTYRCTWNEFYLTTRFLKPCCVLWRIVKKRVGPNNYILCHWNIKRFER